MDGAYVAVKFPGAASSVNNQSTTAPPDSDPSLLLQDCRLLRIDELQVRTTPMKIFFILLMFTHVSHSKSIQVLVCFVLAGGQNWGNSKGS